MIALVLEAHTESNVCYGLDLECGNLAIKISNPYVFCVLSCVYLA